MPAPERVAPVTQEQEHARWAVDYIAAKRQLTDECLARNFYAILISEIERDVFGNRHAMVWDEP